MKLVRRGKDISVSVENITPFGIWLFVNEREYFLSYKNYPYFKEQTLNSIQNVQLLHGYHLFWPELDVDLEIDNLENPEKYPLKFKVIAARESSKRLAKSGTIVKRGLTLVRSDKRLSKSFRVDKKIGKTSLRGKRILPAPS